MTKITNVLNSQTGQYQEYDLNDGKNEIIDGNGMLALPGLIDPHVHFRTPGMEYKENWISGASAAFKGGYTTVFDMPNTIPATTTKERLAQKITLIDEQIAKSGLALRYKLFFGADKNNFHQLAQLDKSHLCGIKVFMGSSTGELLMDDESSLHALYALASRFGLIVALHAEDELTIKQNLELYAKFLEGNDFSYHSKIRSVAAATKAINLVIYLSELYDVTSYILHVSSKEEIDLVASAKARGLKIIAETCPHYLFLDDSAYAKLAGKAKMNPPLRTKADQDYLWQALNDGVIDTIGSDHAPHTLAEKEQNLCKCPSGVPGIELTLPLLLTACVRDKKISLSRIIELLHATPKRVFNLDNNDDIVFANINEYNILNDANLATKAKWSPYVGMSLTGFVKYVYSRNKLYS
jgi:dihydroorotase